MFLPEGYFVVDAFGFVFLKGHPLPQKKWWFSFCFFTQPQKQGYQLPKRQTHLEFENHLTRNQNPGDWRVVRDNPSHKSARISDLSVFFT